MSKSKGNIIDPLDLSGTYGTDALRIALIFSTAAGNDIPLSEDKIRGMKFFTNKLWNIARFIELQRAVADTNPGSGDVNTADQELQKKITELTTSVSTNIDAFRLHDAAQTLYQFIWHEFADIYIEDVKKRMDAKSFLVLSDSFITLLKLLHPFMPFVTEEIWSKMPHKETTPLIVSSWPTGK